MITRAKADVAAGNILSDQMIRESKSNTALELDRINRERMRLMEQKEKMEKAAIMINQNNAGGTTVNTTNMNPNTGRVADPYSNSYMGQQMPSFL
jgi:phosphopantetheine adenylyltransferase